MVDNCSRLHPLYENFLNVSYFVSLPIVIQSSLNELLNQKFESLNFPLGLREGLL